MEGKRGGVGRKKGRGGRGKFEDWRSKKLSVFDYGKNDPEEAVFLTGADTVAVDFDRQYYFTPEVTAFDFHREHLSTLTGCVTGWQRWPPVSGDANPVG
jgi:hypothetical protein